MQGQGLKTRLAGKVQIRSTPEQPRPQVSGDIRTVEGSYRAYGVDLTLESGLLHFAGAYDDPALDILAIRPHTSKRVGVRVLGSAQRPDIRLYAEPELPDAEKLAWLVLGRSANGPGGDLAILQQAALSLMGRNGQPLDGGLAKALGLDDLSYRAASVASDGSVTTAAVNLGKRLSSRLYVEYGHSLAGAVGTVTVLYDLSKALTLRAKAGDTNVLELVYTRRYD